MNRRVRRVRAHVLARSAGDQTDAGVALLAALMTIMILTALSVLVIGIVVSQVTTTHFAEKNTRTIYAAEAGVEATLGKIRTAAGSPDFTGRTFGDARQLPCTLTGWVDSSTSGSTYSVTVDYFASNPAGQTTAWRTANKLSCVAGNGTGSVLPAFAYVTSHGQATSSARITASTADRGISMVYQFQTTTTNVKGGRIWSWKSAASDPQFCLQADGLTDGSTVSYKAASDCQSSANENTQFWIYDTDYTIKLASSTLTSTPLCITVPPSGAPGGANALLKSCATVATTQEYAWHSGGNATWQAQDTGLNDNGSCLRSSHSSGNAVAGDKLQVVNPCANQTNWGSFSPDPAVGPGAASVATHQIVNFLEFGRCMDVTDTDVSKAYMISYPCKQDPPGGANLYWNHRWFYVEPLVGTVGTPQNIYVQKDDGSKYCLKEPAGLTNPTDTSTSTALGSAYYPILSSTCSTLASDKQLWVRSMNTGDKITSWTIRDASTLTKCIGAAGPKYAGKWTTLVLAPCDGSTAQKWNAPADSVEAKVGNYNEETG